MSLAYDHIVTKQNRSAAIKRENQHMDEMEREAAPLMISVAVLIVVVAAWFGTSDYRDAYIAKHQNKRLSSIVAACANGGAVLFAPGHWLMCDKAKQMEIMK